MSEEFPETNRIIALLVDRLPQGAAVSGPTRLRLVTSLLATMLQIIDRSPELTSGKANDLFDEALAMSAAALGAPVSKEI